MTGPRRVAATLLCLAPPWLAASPAATQEPAPAPAPEKSYRDLLTDDEDARFDVSELIFSRAAIRFLPVPLLVTEPAVGYGGGLAAVFFHQRPDISSGQLVPPSVSVGAGAYTSDGSWVGGGGHFHSWKSDTWRAHAFAGRASLDLSSAGLSPTAAPDDEVAYTIDTAVLLVEGSRRVLSRWRLGMRYVYLESDVTLDREGAAPVAGTSALGGLSLLLRFDSRDSMISPRRGQRLDLRPAWFDGAFGSDTDFFRLDSDYTGYWRPDPWGIALRVDADLVGDEAPFYAKPFIELRGVPAMELLGERVLSAELQVDRDVDARWSVLAFGGAGQAWNDLPLRGRVGRDVYTGGVGFRYLLARVLGLRAGIDLAATSDGDHAAYIVMASPWR